MKFLKMHGIGNDFIMTHGYTDAQVKLIVPSIPRLCDRRKGIGADGVIFVMDAQGEAADFRMRIFNADGSEPQMCGNGIRCFALYLHVMGISSKPDQVIETGAGPITTVREHDQIKVSMGAPILDAQKIPTSKDAGRAIMEPIEIDRKVFHVTAVSMGNPHGVVYADELTDELVLHYGALLGKHSFFPEQANIEFITVLSDNEIAMRVYERGCGETLACGTGACAAVVSGIINKKHANAVTVHLLGGDLFIEWDGDPQHPVMMKGPAEVVFRGECDTV